VSTYSRALFLALFFLWFLLPLKECDKKGTAKPTERETAQHKKQTLYEHKPSAGRFPTYASRQLKKMYKCPAHVSIHQLQETDFWGLKFF
jgi:hypothetical protein